MAKPELGSKRQCLSCGAKFFDLNRDPILCPKCGAVFQIAPTRSPARAEVEEAEPTSPETASLEEVDVDNDKAAAAEDEIEIEIEDDGDEPDDTFLEEEEEDADDVAALIDGDIETDDEG